MNEIFYQEPDSGNARTPGPRRAPGPFLPSSHECTTGAQHSGGRPTERGTTAAVLPDVPTEWAAGGGAASRASSCVCVCACVWRGVCESRSRLISGDIAHEDSSGVISGDLSSSSSGTLGYHDLGYSRRITVSIDLARSRLIAISGISADLGEYKTLTALLGAVSRRRLSPRSRTRRWLLISMRRSRAISANLGEHRQISANLAPRTRCD